MSTLERQLRTYVLLRLAVIAAVGLGLFLTDRALAEAGVEPEVGGRVILLGLTSLLYLLLRRPLARQARFQAYVQFVGDLLLITLVVLNSGGPTSPFSWLYVIVIIVASMLLRGWAGTVAAAIAFALYLTVLLLQPDVTTPSIWAYSLVAHLVGFFTVAGLVSYLNRTLDRKEVDLAELKVVHRDVVESIPSGIATTDLDGIFTSINRAGTEILGRAPDDLVGSAIHDTELVTRDEWGRLTYASERGKRLRSEAVLHRDGERVDIGYSISALTDSDERRSGYIVIFQDVTAWRRLEEEVRLKDRMAAVGELAAGLAHEIGNPLAAISGSVQMLSRGERSASEAKLLEILLKESQRLDRTIKGFLRFARPKERTAVRFDIAKLLTENTALLENSPEVGDHHEIELDVAPQETLILGDPDQISQIFWNLARNALKAMPDGGELSIRGHLSGNLYQLRFADTGHGMSEQERANLFHPFKSFFDSGTGIGMAIVYQIVQTHGGELKVESEPDKGTAIIVDLPAVTLPEDMAAVEIAAEEVVE